MRNIFSDMGKYFTLQKVKKSFIKALEKLISKNQVIFYLLKGKKKLCPSGFILPGGWLLFFKRRETLPGGGKCGLACLSFLRGYYEKVSLDSLPRAKPKFRSIQNMDHKTLYPLEKANTELSDSLLSF